MPTKKKSAKKQNKTNSFIWQAGALRLTAFHSLKDNPNVENWWKQLTGEESEKRVTESKKKIVIEEGDYKDGSLVLKLAPGRIDLVLNSKDEPEDVNIFPTLGELKSNVNSFLELSNKLLKLPDYPMTNRLAFGAICVFPVETRKSGYDNLNVFLGDVIKIDSDDSFDLLYQINRRRNSKSDVPGLSINRLQKWYVGTRNISVVMVSPDKKEHALSSADAVYACMLELDINTSKDFQDHLPKGKLNKICKELTDLGIEISQNGDIK